MPITTEIPEARPIDDIQIQRPHTTDGAAMWRIAWRSAALDLNSSYAYLMFCRDFAQTCRLAYANGEPAGYLLAYARPERPETLFVWQVAVDERARGRGLASRLLDDLVQDLAGSARPVRHLETTITPDNAASQRLFRSFARRWGDAPVTTADLFAAEHFPDDHAGEVLYSIGPIEDAHPRR